MVTVTCVESGKKLQVRLDDINSLGEEVFLCESLPTDKDYIIGWYTRSELNFNESEFECDFVPC